MDPLTATVVLAALLVAAAAVRPSTAPADEGDDAGPSAEPAPADPATGAAPPDPPDEEVVRDLLEANGGRLPQADLVRRTEWSKSKVSRLLARMDDAGEVTKIDIGRGNVIAIPGEEPPGAARPFEG